MSGLYVDQTNIKEHARGATRKLLMVAKAAMAQLHRRDPAQHHRKERIGIVLGMIGRNGVRAHAHVVVDRRPETVMYRLHLVVQDRGVRTLPKHNCSLVRHNLATWIARLLNGKNGVIGAYAVHSVEVV